MPLSQITHIQSTTHEQSIQHKDLQTVVYVMGDVAGASDSLLYGNADITSTLSTLIFNGQPLQQPFTAPSMIALAGIVVCNCLHIQCSDTGVLWNDPATEVIRHADTGYPDASACARENGIDRPEVLR